MTNQTILLDLDETLISTMYRQYLVLDAFADKFNLSQKFTYEEYYVTRKNNFLSNTEFFLNNGLDIELLDDFVKFYKANIESSYFLSFDTLLVDPMLLSRISKKLNLILISLRSNEKNSCQQLKKMNLYNYFREVYFLPHSRNNPKTSVINSLKKDYSNCFFIGDSDTDYEAAKENGIRFEGVNSYFHEPKCMPMPEGDINSILVKIADEV